VALLLPYILVSVLALATRK